MGDAERANLNEAVAVVRRDIETTMGEGAVEIEIPWGSEPADAWISIPGVTPLTTGVVTHPGEPLDHLIVRVADTIQDCIVESRRYRGQAWPKCPVHPSANHPLSPRSIEGHSHWVCPVFGESVAAIGMLPASRSG